MAAPETTEQPARTPLYEEHVALQARMVPFAGYDMPVQYPGGILAEHLWTREHAGLFDVSHMGQAFLIAADHAAAARALEALVPADVLNLAQGRQRYTQLLDAEGGILDDLMITRSVDPKDDGKLMLVLNASMKNADCAHISAHLPAGVRLERADDRALLALQGPKAADVMRRLGAPIDDLAFMAAQAMQVAGFDCHISRSGYTGEDGFEISVRNVNTVALWRALLADAEVKPIGLGARDSLRLEAGLCLYGHDIDRTTTPVEAGLVWSIQKRRREEGGFPAAAIVQKQIAEGTTRARVGLLPDGRAPAREGTTITAPDGREIGTVTSGGFGPSVNGPIAMGYVDKAFSQVGTVVNLIVRGKPLSAKVAAMPFVPHRYKR